MTREHKVALIVGFSLILLIAVLLSDHFSRARSARLEPIREGEFALHQPGESGGGPGAAPVDPLFSLEQPAVPAPSVSEPGTPPIVNEPATIADAGAGAAPTPGPSDTQLAADIARLAGAANADTVVPGAGGSLTILPMPAGSFPASNPTDAPAESSLPPAAPPAESIRLHPVKKGENLYRIAEKYYGSGAKWKKLADANRDRVSADGTVREGVQLRIPDAPAAPPSNAKPAEKKPAKPAAKPETKPGPIRIAKAPTPRTYTVRRGDTLGQISLKTLGTSRRAAEIKTLNGIEDEDDISAGAVLKLPGA